MFPAFRERVYLEQIGLCLSLVTFYGNVFTCIYELLVGRRVAKKTLCTHNTSGDEGNAKVHIYAQR